MENENTVINDQIVESPEVQQEEVKEVKTYTQDELEAIIKSNVDRAVAKAHKEAQQKIDEAEKMRKMNAEQKAQYEMDKLKAEIEEYKARDTRYAMEREAMNLLNERGWHSLATHSLLD